MFTDKKEMGQPMKEEKQKNKRCIIYIVLILILLVIPFAGMSFWATDSTTENRELAEWPSLTEDGTVNLSYLEDVGTCLEDHLAFRSQMLTANALIWGAGFRTSTTDQVIVGKGDWLYYGGTLDDYTGEDLLSDRELRAVVHNLSLMQDYVEEQGSEFVLVIAPNKNTLYNDFMPYYYSEGETNNLENLVPLLADAGIQYVDLVEAFSAQEEVLYFHRDTHWNNAGALLVFSTVMDQIGKEHETYRNVPYEIRTDHIGDIDELLYPLAAQAEDNVYYDIVRGYQYVNEVEDDMDSWIETENTDRQGVLLMYRDSFGESLLPFFADEYNMAYFSRLVPYDLCNVDDYHPDTVIVERTERKIAAFATEIPMMEGPVTENLSAPERETETTLTAEMDGSWLILRGLIDEACMGDNTDIYVAVSDSNRTQTVTYETFYTLTNSGGGNGYWLYVKQSSLPSDEIHVNIIVSDGSQRWIVKTEDISLEALSSDS
ncbi:MAG: hypothetical protein LUE14_04870 [Clostridiales bacterium]|nr:hypothetical protein [Clostridiales bacterium]